MPGIVAPPPNVKPDDASTASDSGRMLRYGRSRTDR
jgi:hypothetical protein